MVYSNQHVKRAGNRISVPSSFAPYNRSLRLVDNNEEEAFRLNAIAAKEGMHDAVLAMGWFYLNGIGATPNEDEAIRWYRKSARQGESRAMFSLGYIAYVHKDYPEALTWFQRAVQKDHHRSNFWIGKMYWRGQGVERDRKQAQGYFAEAAKHKVAEAQRAVRYLAFLLNRMKAGSTG